MRWHVFLLLLVFIMGCSSESQPHEPPRILYGQDACDQCRMIINDPAFAAAYRLADGTPRRFDDIGCMVRYIQEHNEQPAYAWVHDYDTEAWIDARSAYYIRSARIITPMAYGFIAVSSRERATQLADSLQGEVFTYDELLPLAMEPLIPQS